MRRELIAALVVGAALLLPGLGARDLWNPNEPLYGQAVREMHAAGEWLIPTAGGERFVEKPPLYFWLALAAAAAWGVDEFTLRLPSAFAALVGMLAVYGIGLRLSGRFVARAAALVFFSAAVVAQSARQVQMDLLLTSVVAVAVWLALIGLQSGRALAWFGFGAAAGLGLLAKGPVAWVITAVAVGGFAWGRRGAARKVRLPRAALAALAGCAATVGPWLVALAAHGELGVLGEMFFRQQVTRFLDPWDHARPAGYYLKYLWIDFAPWSWLLPAAIGVCGRGRRAGSWIWLIGTLVFVSLSASKRSVYLMPAMPAVALLVAELGDVFFHGTLAGWRRRFVRGWLAVTTIVLPAAAALAVWLWRASIEVPRVAGPLAIGLALLAVAAALPRALGRGRFVSTTCWLAALLVLQSVASLWWMPRFDRVKSARPLATEVKAELSPSVPLDGYRLWRWRLDYAYYLDRPLGRCADAASARALWLDAEPRCLLVEEAREDEFRAAVENAAGTPRVRRRVGSKQVSVWCNPASAGGDVRPPQ